MTNEPHNTNNTQHVQAQEDKTQTTHEQQGKPRHMNHTKTHESTRQNTHKQTTHEAH